MTRIALLISVLTAIGASSVAQAEQVRVHRGSGPVYGPPNSDAPLGDHLLDHVGFSDEYFRPIKPLPPIEASPADQKACQQVHLGLGYPKDTSTRYCKREKRAKRSLTSGFANCVETLKRASNGNLLAPFCFNLNDSMTTPKITSCLVQTLNATKADFWALEDEQGMRNGPNLDLPFSMKEVLHECAHPVSSVEARNARVVGLAAYNSLLAFDEKGEALGGLSGLTRQGDNELLSITDSKDRPLLHKFKYQVSENPTRVEIHYDGHVELRSAGNDSDFEDLALLPNGELLASTEVVSEGKAKKLFGKSNPPSLLLKFDQSFGHPVAIDVPQELMPYSEQKEVDCGPPPGSTGHAPEKAKREQADWKSHKCYDFQQSGIQFNKGLEGMTYDAPSNSVYFAPEQPLSQNKPEFSGYGTLPLYRAHLNGSGLANVESFKYALDTTNENGISALLALDHETILVLERGFDQFERRAKMKLYKVHLSGVGVLEKHLLVDFDGLRSQVPVGFQNLDNFEGIALGPKLANGHRILFLVSDNNFSSVQKTLLMTLEVTGAE